MLLFTTNPVKADALYTAFRDGNDPRRERIRIDLEALWLRFQAFADRPFLSDFPNHPHSRFWEMYLTCALVDTGLGVSPAKPGPDLRLSAASSTVWIEATAPGPGIPGGADTMPEPDLDPDAPSEVTPDRRTILRYCQAIKEKGLVQYPKHLAAGIVHPKEPYVIALNSGGVFGAIGDGLKGILAAVFGLGATLVTFDTSGRVASVFTSYHPAVKRHVGARVSTNAFFDPTYRHVSAILFSTVTVADSSSLTTTSFTIIHNPSAAAPLPSNLIPGSAEYHARRVGEEWLIGP